jgi:hypothetical protein
MSAIQSVVWGLRCDNCGFTDYQAPKVAAARHLARDDGWTQKKPSATATKARIDICPECTDARRAAATPEESETA